MKESFQKLSYRTILIFLAVLYFGNLVFAQEKIKSSSQNKEAQYKIGVLGSNFIKFKTDEMIDMVGRLGIKYLSVKEKHLPFESTDDQIAEFHKKLSEKGITAYSVGLFYLNKREDVDQVFKYAKRVGVKMVVGTPQYELLPYINQKVKEYNLKFAIHIHGGDIALYPNAKDVFEHIKELDPRIGICLDVSHEMRAGFDPSESLKKYFNRIIEIHIKDVTAANTSGRSCVLGKGVMNIPGFIKTLYEIGYMGASSLELEEERNDPLPGLAESKGYFEAVEDMLTRKY